MLERPVPEFENEVARLKLIAHLLSEALRIADAGHRHIIGAKIADSAACVEHELSDALDRLEKRSHG